MLLTTQSPPAQSDIAGNDLAGAGRPSRRRRSSADPKVMEEVTLALKERWDVEEASSRRFVRRHKGLPSEQLISFVEELESLLARMHQAHFGYDAADEVLRRAVEYSLDRLALYRGGLSEKQLAYFVQYARDEVASEQTRHSDPGNPKERIALLQPLREVIECEEDDLVRDRLEYVFDLFVKRGLRIPKKDIIHSCLKEKVLFARRRAVEDTIETLRSAYEALGFENGELFVTPEYIELGMAATN